MEATTTPARLVGYTSRAFDHDFTGSQTHRINTTAQSIIEKSVIQIVLRVYAHDTSESKLGYYPSQTDYGFAITIAAAA